MHLNKHVPKITLFLTLGLLLTSCAVSSADTPEHRMRSLRSQYQAMDNFTAEAQLTADYGDRVYTYTVSIGGDVSSGSMTVEAPENIAGTVLQWSDGTTSLSYEEVTLDTGPLTDSGLSPADAMPVILSACRVGTLLECSLDGKGDPPLLYARLEHPDDADITASCWFDPDSFALRRSELAQGGTTIITFEFTDFTMVSSAQEGDLSQE